MVVMQGNRDLAYDHFHECNVSFSLVFFFFSLTVSFLVVHLSYPHHRPAQTETIMARWGGQST